MKTKLYIYTILLVVFSFVGCEKFLEEDSKGSLTIGGYYQSLEDLKLSVPAIPLQFNGAFNQTWGAVYAGDDITSKNSGNKVGFHEIDVFKHNSSNDRIPNWWTYFYSTIKVANPVIAQDGKIEDANNKEEINNLIGVAYFYRAMSYFFLTRTWGEVPVNTDGSLNKNRPNSSVKEVYDLIVSDMKKAEEFLPNTWAAPYNQEGVNVFPTKGSAKALSANVYLTMAGWPLKQTDKYALAAQKAKEVIDNKAIYGYGLEDIHQLWRKRFTNETVVGCYYNVNIAGWSWENGSQLGPQSFGCDEEGDWEDGYGEINFYNNFPAGPRKDETYQAEYWLKRDANGNPTKKGDYTQTKVKHPFFLKYRYDNHDWTKHKSINWWGSATVPIIRYAEVLLTYAEAQAMSVGADQSAYDAINEVRTRAGLPNLTSGLSKEEFKKAVIAERGWEFAGPEPAARWFDLLRTETLAKANSSRNAAEFQIDAANMPNDQTHKGYWMPIPVDN